jgi:hypothetical protein
MKRCSALIGCICCFFLVSFTVAFAEEKSIAEPAVTDIAPAPAEEKSSMETTSMETSRSRIEQLLILLKDRNLISEEDITTISRKPEAGKKPENMNSLLNLLQAKGLISVEEAANLADDEVSITPSKKVTGPAGRHTASVPLILPMDDRRFLQVLKDKWIAKEKKIDNFYPTFNDSRDPEYIIGRMKELEVISDDEAFDLIRQYRTTYLSGAVSATLENKEKGYLDRVGKNVTAEMEKNVLSKIRNEWTQRLKLGGDMRLRYEGVFFDAGNADILRPDAPTQLMNSKIDRQRFLVRARINLEAKVTDEVTAGIGLATGNTTNPVSTNATLGDSFNKKSFQIDRAYLKWSPDPSLSVWGGRFPNPWFSTDLVWDQDINFEGVAVQYSPQLTSTWGLFFNGGAFPIQEVEFSSKDKWLFGAQAGVNYQDKDKLSARLSAAYYHFENTVGIVNDITRPGLTDWTAPQFQQKGNSLMDIDPTADGVDRYGNKNGTGIKTAYASAFKVLNITGSLDLAFWHPIHITLLGDYVNNLGFNKSEVIARRGGADVKEETQGYQVGVTVGTETMQKLWDWKARFTYKYLESDAVMDAFTDSDFHLGGTNAKGWIIGGDLGLAKNTWISTRWFSTNEISGPPLAIDVFHFDINTKF